MDKPRISVFIITYNQESVIRRTMDSLVFQKDYLYEICINDDCSTDQTFEILKEYEQQYSGLVKPKRNDQNLGIFANTEAAWKRPSGDIVYETAGDDECPNGYFEAVLDFIEKNKIDWRNELFCIYGDYKEIEPNGMSVVYSNKMAPNHDALKLAIRHLINNRSACFSRKVLDRFVNVSEGKSFSAESSQDIQLALFAEKNYYIPVVGNIYYAGIGVSSRMSKNDKKQHLYEGFKKVTDFVASQGHPFDKKDLAYIEYFKAYRLGDMKKALKYYIKSIDLSLGIKGLNIDRIIYVIKKRLLKQ